MFTFNIVRCKIHTNMGYIHKYRRHTEIWEAYTNIIYIHNMGDIQKKQEKYTSIRDTKLEEIYTCMGDIYNMGDIHKNRRNT